MGNETEEYELLIKGIWKERELEIEGFFNELLLYSPRKDNLRVLLSRYTRSFSEGKYLTGIFEIPFDFTLQAISYDGTTIYHPTVPEGQKRNHSVDHAKLMAEMVSKKNGSIIWKNTNASQQIKAIFKGKNLKNQRLTKIYFRNLPEYEAIALYESHINLIANVGPPSDYMK